MRDAVLATFQQWALFCGVVAAVGCVAWTLVVARGASVDVSGAHAQQLRLLERRVATWGVGVGVGLIAVWILRMVVQVRAFRDPFVPLWDDLSFLLFETFSGTVWMAQGVLIPLLMLAFLLARPTATGDQGSDAGSLGERSGRILAARWISAGLVLALVATLALSSHAMGVDSRRALIVAADGVHLLAAGSWVGSLAIILTVGGGARGPLYAAQLRSFSPMAMVSVAALILMGVVLSWTHLHSVSDLWTARYGRVLSAKVALAGLVFLAGLWNWRRGLPSLNTTEGAARVQRRAALEVSLAIGVLVLSAILVHSPEP